MVQWVRESLLLLKRLWLKATESPEDRQVRLAVERLIAGCREEA